MIYGLTGGMGCGKSTVSRILKTMGYEIVDADLLTRKVHQNPAVCKLLEEAFGTEIFDITPENRTLNRQKLGAAAFKCEENRRKLNEIMHPALMQAAKDALSQARTDVILDAPLLFEANWDKLVDKTVVVLCPLDMRIARILSRDGLERKQVEARIRAQISDEERCRRADFFLYNVGSLENLERQVFQVFRGC